MDVRKELGLRIAFYMAKGGLNPEQLATLAGLSLPIVEGYLRGEREIAFPEVRPICEALRIHIMHLLVYPVPNGATD